MIDFERDFIKNCFTDLGLGLADLLDDVMYYYTFILK